MNVKTITWHPKSRLVEIAYEDGVKGSMVVPEEWGAFRGLFPDATERSHIINWEWEQPHPYTIYMTIKDNGQAAESLQQGSLSRQFD